MNYVAIDFETANEKRYSACSLGIAIIKDGEISETRSWLIRPPELRFEPINISIHGITPDHVFDAPEFNVIWPEILPYLTNNVIVAHNASFDLSVLRAILSVYNLPFPELSYFCSLKTARKVWPGLFSYRLDVVSEHLGINFSHHNAEDDAYACALIIKQAAIALNCSSILELATGLEYKLGQLFSDGYCPSKLNSSPAHKATAQEGCNFDQSHPFFNKHVTFTGTLQSMQRKQAIQKVINIGGYGSDNVIEKTRYLVIGELDYRTLKDGKKSNKIKRAEQLLDQGQKIEMITEMEFLRMVDN